MVPASSASGSPWLSRLLTGLLLMAAGGPFLAWAGWRLWVWAGLPPELSRSEVAPGVYVTVEELNIPHESDGRVVVVEVHLDTPGTDLVFRPFDDRAVEEGRHFRLAFADWIMRRQDYVALLNTVRYHPGARHRSWPGAQVVAVESVVVEGRWSHAHEHSFMIWWDVEGKSRVEPTKLSGGRVLDQAVYGVGVQAVQVRNGAVVSAAIASSGEGLLKSQSFLGVDPERNIVWLIAFENTSERGVANYAARLGVVEGGRLDSGNATNLLLGRNLSGLRSYVGIRNPRPLAHYVAVRHRPLEN